MKRFKKVYILLGVLAVVCIVTAIVTHTEEKKEQIKNSEETIMSVSADSVQSLSWEYGDTSLAFHKDGSWLWDDDDAFPVDNDKVEKLLSDFENFGAAFTIEDVEDYGQYGLDDPECTIRLATEDQEYEILLGAYSTMDSQRYVSIGDGSVYLVKKDPYDDFNIVLDDLFKHDTTKSFETVKEITFSGAENYTVKRDEECVDTYCDDDIYFTEKDGKNLPLDTENVESYCKNITKISLIDYVSYNVTDEELAAWGLDDPELIVTVKFSVTEDGNELDDSFTLNVGLDPDDVKEKEEKEADGETYNGYITAYARVGDSKIVYQLSVSDYNKLVAASYNDLRHEEVLSASFNRVTGIDITLEDESYAITTEENDDGYDYFYKGEEIAIAGLKSDMTDLAVNEFTTDEPTDKEEISLTFHTDIENYPEIKVSLYRCDGTNCIAVLNGEVLGLVSRSDVVDLIEVVNSIILG